MNILWLFLLHWLLRFHTFILMLIKTQNQLHSWEDGYSNGHLRSSSPEMCPYISDSVLNKADDEHVGMGSYQLPMRDN